MKFLGTATAIIAALALFPTQARADASGTLAHCCNEDDPTVECSEVEQHGDNDHSSCKTEFTPDAKRSICSRKITSNGVTMYQASVQESGGQTNLLGIVDCGGGQQLVAFVHQSVIREGNSMEIAPGGRGLTFRTPTGSCSATCFSPSGSGSACNGFISDKR